MVSKVKIRKNLTLLMCAGGNRTLRLNMAYTNPDRLGGRQDSYEWPL